MTCDDDFKGGDNEDQIRANLANRRSKPNQPQGRAPTTPSPTNSGRAVASKLHREEQCKVQSRAVQESFQILDPSERKSSSSERGSCHQQQRRQLTQHSFQKLIN